MLVGLCTLANAAHVASASVSFNQLSLVLAPGVSMRAKLYCNVTYFSTITNIHSPVTL